VVKQVTVTWNAQTQSYSEPELCSWVCDNAKLFCADATLCLFKTEKSCLPVVASEGFTNDIKPVTVQCTSDGSFETPANCALVCDNANGYCDELGQCLKSTTRNCDPNNANPPNSEDIPKVVTVQCDSQSGLFAAPTLCDWQCSAGYVLTADGTSCIRPNNCTELKAQKPFLPSGVYDVDPDGSGPLPERKVYCEMSGQGVTIEYGIGDVSVSYPGWGVVGATHFGRSKNQLAFIAYYNANSGATLLKPAFNGTTTDCQFRNSSDSQGALDSLTFGGKAILPADGVTFCGPPPDAAYLGFGLETIGSPQLGPLAGDFFASNPPATLTPQAPEAGKPAFFFSAKGHRSCVELKAEGMPSGIYQLYVNDPARHYLRTVYCDMVTETAYSFGFGLFGTLYPNWLRMTLSDLTTTSVQEALIAYYNAADGLLNLQLGQQPTGACWFQAQASSPSFISFGSLRLVPYVSDTAACLVPIDSERVRFGDVDKSAPEFPLASDFFSKNPPSLRDETTAPGSYPAFFIDRFRPTSCADYKARGFTSDGVYWVDRARNPLEVYCDMTTGTTIEAFGMARYSDDRSAAGWELIDLASWNTTALQNAFIWYYNGHNGIQTLDKAWTNGNCCVALSSTSWLAFGTRWVGPLLVSGGTGCYTTIADDVVQLQLEQLTPVPPPLAANYFQTHPVGTHPCVDDENPGIFVKRWLVSPSEQ
ncbi:MAG: hypothetical protein KC609_07460, partial [Myxococcales bacterium]|nr:hypothetical protein [Myxococcales bacterium]